LWLDVLSKTKARGVTFLLAAHLIYEAWRHDSDQVKLANVTLRKQGLSRWSKYRAVQELRAAGLIAVDERERKSPIVTVRFWRV
jgi:hypothetical protein